MRSRVRVVVVLAVVAVAVVAVVLARGGGNDGKQVTHAQLVEQANAICGRLARANAALEPPPKPYDDQSEPFFSDFGDNVAKAKDELDALQPPSEDADELDRLVGLYDRLGVNLEELQTAAAVEQGQEIVILIDEAARVAEQMTESERALGICPGDTSARVAIAASLRRSRPNPLSETGPLDG
jgi:hypothetical protein